MADSVWDTSASDACADTGPGDSSTLGQHREQCSARNARWATVCSGAGQVMGFVSSRLVTLVAVVGTVAALWWSWV